MLKILFLHGFSSCGRGNKSKMLKAYFGESAVIAQNLPYSPHEAIETLDKLIASEKIDLLIGSSLGGFYATYLAEKHRLKAVLLNPSTQPWKTLAPYVGMQKRFCDDEPFKFKKAYLKELKSLKVNPLKGRYLVLLQSEDELLDYTKAQSLYNTHHVIVEYGGNHRFENIDVYMSMIRKFRTLGTL
ncbi:MAG TPA: hypothetical protein EYG82_06010 [Sulfurovum sp.]|nr:hypothetical protein [Sulfurovum sp.]